jgi:hypothetical protein
MISFRSVRRSAVLMLLASVLSASAVVTGATAASADPKCTGKIGVHTESRANTYVGFSFLHGGGGAIKVGNPSRIGTEYSPIVKFTTPADRAIKVLYYDLHSPGVLIDTDYVDHGGSFNINPCHFGIVKVY